MRKILLIIMLSLLVLSGEHLEAQKPELNFDEITVVSDDNYPPFIFRDNDGNLQGILLDQWKLWEQKTGIKVRLIGIDWNKAQKYLKEGKADVIDTMFFTEERAKLYDFSKPYAKIEVPIFFYKTISGINNIKSVKGFSVAVKKGDACINIFRKHGIKEELVKYNSYEDIIKAAAENKIRMFCMDKPPALYFLYKYNIAKEYRHSFSLYTGEFHRAVRKGRTGLLTVIEDGFSRISDKEYAAIHKKWFGTPILTIPGYIKYLGIILAVVVIVLVIFFLLTLFLRKQVRKKTFDLVKANQLLRKSEKKYRTLLETTSEGCWLLNPELKTIEVNKSLCKMLGYSQDEMLGKTPFDFVDNENRKIFIEQTSKISSTEHSNYAITLKKKSGEDLHTYFNATTIRDESGEVQRSFAFITDITKYKQTQEELNRLGAAIEQASESIIISDEQGTIQYINPSFEKLSGFTQEDIIGQNFRILKSDKHDEAFYREMYDIISTGKIWQGHITNTMKDGTLREFETSISPVYDGSEKIINYISVNRDVTHEVALEAQLRQAQKMEAIGVLAGGMAHDFNNILTTILGYASLALMSVGKDDTLREDIEEIKIAGERAAALTRQLLAFSRKQIIQPKILDLNELLADIEKMLGRLISEDIELLTILEPALWQVEADPGQMEQVIMNLVVNARDAMPMGGKITIETANTDLDESYFREHGIEDQPGSYVMLAVSDTGSGMDKETQKRIFEPFYTTKEQGKGTGLGLSTVYGIVKQSGGYVWAYSEIGQGTTFKVYLPKVVVIAKSEEKEIITTADLSGSETVLIVEDDDLLLNLAQKVLQQHGYRILMAENGEDALMVSKAHDGSIDLLITDVVMPKMGGKETAERLQPIYPQMKVIYMSGHTDNSIVHHGVLAPGLNFLEKPFSPEGLARKVREVLDEAMASAQE